MAAVGTLIRLVIGQRAEVPESMLRRFPELRHARFRRGGLPVRIGGWALGRPSVAAITLWRTVFLSREVAWNAELLLHELRHVHQFQADRAFPLRYVWESLRRGYHRNPFEADARAYAKERLRAGATDPRRGDL